MGNLQISPKRMHGSSLRNTIPCQRLYKFWEEPYVAARLGRKDRVMLTAGCKPESMHFVGVGKITSQGKETDCPLKGSELTSPHLSKHTDRQLRPILNFWPHNCNVLQLSLEKVLEIEHELDKHSTPELYTLTIFLLPPGSFVPSPAHTLIPCSDSQS